MRISDWSSDVCSSDPAEPVEHLAGLEPAIGLDCLLRDIGEHRISAAEGHHRHLAEEGGDAAEHVVGAEREQQRCDRPEPERSEEHTSELQSLMRISYAVFCLKKKKIIMKRKNNVDSKYHHCILYNIQILEASYRI